jgi:hypothetical protein
MPLSALDRNFKKERTSSTKSSFSKRSGAGSTKNGQSKNQEAMNFGSAFSSFRKKTSGDKMDEEVTYI